MKIGFYVQRVAGASGFERVVSAHVQVPLHTMALLRDASHEVQLITTAFTGNRSLPHLLPQGVPVHTVAYGSRQGDALPMHAGNRAGVRPLKLAQQLSQIRRIVRRERFDILHFSGSTNLIYLIGLLRMIGVDTPMVLTINIGALPTHLHALSRWFWRRAARVLTSTQFFRQQLQTRGIDAQLVAHGPLPAAPRQPRPTDPAARRHRVLFWRDPSSENGADLTVEVFTRLAPRFPEVSFDFAVRPHWEPVAGLHAAAAAHPNITLHEFPYRDGISIPQLLDESICVVMPFRQLSTHPQLAILESMRAGVPVVTTALDSNLEIIDDGHNGLLTPVGDVESTERRVERLLVDRTLAAELGARAASDVATRWSWNDYLSTLVGVYEGLGSPARHDTTRGAQDIVIPG